MTGRVYKPAEERFAVGVVLERRTSTSPWIDATWLPSAVLPGVPNVAPGTVLREGTDVSSVYFGAYEMALYSSDTSNYRANLFTGEPRVWVRLREGAGPNGFQVVGVTADPAEGEAYTEAGNDIVEAVAMPPEIAARVADFVARYHVDRVFFKRKRDGSENGDE